MDKKTAIQMMSSEMIRVKEDKKNISQRFKEIEEDTIKYLHDLLNQIKSSSGPIIPKTPKVTRKRNNTRIQAIPENEEIEIDSPAPSRNNTASSLEVSDARSSRAKRGASIKAADFIKKQQSLNLIAKLRRPSNGDNDSLLHQENESDKRKKSHENSDNEDIRPLKKTKMDKKKAQSQTKNDSSSEVDSTFVNSLSVKENPSLRGNGTKQSLKRKFNEDSEHDSTLISEKSMRKEPEKLEPVSKKALYSNSPFKKQNKTLKPKPASKKSLNSDSSSKVKEKNHNQLDSRNKILEISCDKESQDVTRRITRSSSIINGPGVSKHKKNVINETADASNVDETLASMYEDAISKPLPIMNSTMKPNSTITLERIMNVTVSLEPLSKKIMNETVNVNNGLFKEPTSTRKFNVTQIIAQSKVFEAKTPKACESVRRSTRNQKVTEQKAGVDSFNDIMTDDESSPERKGYRSSEKKRNTRSNNNSLISDEDEVRQTPIANLKNNRELKLPSTIKSTYKSAALFSPYAKDSVKKRVEAFEQVAISPQKIETELITRVTRTKTRALAAASGTPAQAASLSQKLARKSLAKAAKLSLAKSKKDNDEGKENENTNLRYRKKSSMEQSAQKLQPKTTPITKSRLLPVPTSANKNQFTTPSNALSKPLTASRGNIVTHVDSFIQPMKSASKSVDRTAEERKRRGHDENARQKREALLKVQAEEKRRRREEKELKNKLAREAKEKLEYEKRLKAEKEREEKAKLAQQMQEKQKEEMERKRIAQMQRAQEKEERRRQEELLRMQRLQEQEEQERLLAEQKRREQELEKRKQMAELKMKSQIEKAALQAKQAKVVAAQKQAPNNYKIDSDPDEEDTDDESKPKHQIPQWAQKNVRQAQLAMQQYISMRSVLKFFDAKKCTPDLRDLFKGIDPKKLKRTSSAIWKTPPRYSMMDRSIIKY